MLTEKCYNTLDSIHSEVVVMADTKAFRDYKAEERKSYITLSTGEYYPDILEDACRLYSVFSRAGNFLSAAKSF